MTDTEKKNEHQAGCNPLTLDKQDQETMQQFLAEKTVYVYFEKDDEKDFFVPNPDGSITRIARCININGIQWRIPTQVNYPVPQSVYERMLESADDARRMRPILPAGQFVKLGERINGQWRTA